MTFLRPAALISACLLMAGSSSAMAQSSTIFTPVRKDFSGTVQTMIDPAGVSALADLVSASHQALPEAAPDQALQAGLAALAQKERQDPAQPVAPGAQPIAAAEAPVVVQAASAAAPASTPPAQVPLPAPAGTQVAAAQPSQATEVLAQSAGARVGGLPASAWATAYVPQSVAGPAAASPAPAAPQQTAAAPIESLTAETAPVETVAALSPEQAPALAEPALAEPASSAKPNRTISEKDRDCMATAVYFEARKQSDDIQRAVVQVILNRVESGLYPADICETVFQDQYVENGCQFVFTCDGRSETIRDQEAWQKALEAVRQVTTGEVWSDAVAGATHYHGSDASPRWIAEVQEVGTLESYSFYRKS